MTGEGYSCCVRFIAFVLVKSLYMVLSTQECHLDVQVDLGP